MHMHKSGGGQLDYLPKHNGSKMPPSVSAFFVGGYSSLFLAMTCVGREGGGVEGRGQGRGCESMLMLIARR